jgi:hypothetical protein
MSWAWQLELVWLSMLIEIDLEIKGIFFGGVNMQEIIFSVANWVSRPKWSGH